MKFRTSILQFGIVLSVLLVAASSPANAQQSQIHRAARQGNLAQLRSALQSGTSPNLADSHGRTPLMDAAAAGQVDAIRELLRAGAKVNLRARDNRTALIEAAANGHVDAARALIDAGADLNSPEQGWGTPLESAERNGHKDVADLLRRAGARSSGHSEGDTVCVRPWKGNGYCGVVLSVDKTQYRIRITRLVGCENGCPAKRQCSGGRSVGGENGLAIGDTVETVSWCLTDIGVNP